jgi:hypothetical protein
MVKANNKIFYNFTKLFKQEELSKGMATEKAQLMDQMKLNQLYPVMVGY